MADPQTQQPDLATSFRALPPERQKALLGKMNPQQKQNLYGALQRSSQSKPPTAKPAASSPGAGKGFTLDEKPSYLGEALSGLGRTASSLYHLPGQILTPHDIPTVNPITRTTREQDVALGPVGRLLFNPIADTERSFEDSAKAALTAKQHGEGVAGQILEYLDASMFGSAFKKMQEAGPGYAKFEPQTLGGITELGSFAALPKATKVVADLTKAPVARALSSYAEKTYDKALDVKPEASGTDPGSHMARLVGPVWSYSQAVKKAQGLIERITPQIDKLVTDAKAKGTVVKGFDKVVDGVYDPAIKRARASGDARLVEQLKSEKVRASSTVVTDPLTKKEVNAPLDYAKGVDPVTALEKKRAVQSRGWEGGTNETIKTLNRQLGHAMAKALDAQVPGLGKLSAQDAALIDAREAANAAKAKAKVGLQDKLRGMLQAGMPGLMAYGALRLGGAGFGSYFGAAGLMYIWNKLPNATLRASAAARIADLMTGDTVVKPPVSSPRSGAKAGPAVPPSTGAPAATPVGATPTPSVNTAAAPGAVAGAGPIPAAPAPAAPPAAVAAPAAPGAPTIPLHGVDPAPAEVVRRASETAQATAKALGKTPPEPTGRVAPGTSGVPPQMKKYFDMVDETLQKLETAKSGMNKRQYETELNDLKEILNPATPEARRSELASKIDARQRKAASRAKAASEAPVEKSALASTTVKETGVKSFEPLDPAMNQEEAMVKLEELYTAFKSIPDSKQYLGALAKMAKDSKMTTAQIYNESLEVYNFLKANPAK